MHKSNLVYLNPPYKLLIAALLSFCCFPSKVHTQITLAFQGAEPADTWSYTTSGASNIAVTEASSNPNIKSGTRSIVVGGTNVGGGNCFQGGGSGNGTSITNTISFSAINIFSSSTQVRTLSFYYGSRHPDCNGTGWDTGEDLKIIPVHNGVPQAPVTILSGVSDLNVNIKNSRYTYSIPSCVTEFSFSLTLPTNRRDELLFVDDVTLSTPRLNDVDNSLSQIQGLTQLCQSATQTLSVTPRGNTTYNWTGLPVTARFTTANNTATSSSMDIDWGNTPAGRYTITVTPTMLVCNVPVAGSPRSIEIEILPFPVLSITGSTILCQGQSTSLTASGADDYLWSHSLGTNSTVDIHPAISTAYTLTGKIGTCQKDTSILITVRSLPVVTITGNSTTCPGDPVTLQATGADSYIWEDNMGTNSQVTVSPTQATTYTVTGTVNGCSNTVSFSINISAPALTVSSSSNSICKGQSVNLSANTPDDVLWSNNIDNTESIQTTYTVSPEQTTTYYAHTVNNLCNSSGSVTIIVNPLPEPSFTSDRHEGCSPLSVNFTNTTPGNNTYSWNFESGSGASVQHPDHLFTTAGCKSISLTATTLEGCSKTVTASDFICVFSSPIASFSPSQSEINENSSHILFNNNSQNSVNYIWSFGDGFQSSDVSPSHTYDVASLGNYTVTLIAKNQKGCSDTARAVITYNDFPVYYVPNAFTPDGNEYNQIFLPVFTSGFDAHNYTFMIFNRWGELVFESHDHKEGWAGLTQSGHIAPEGIYLYKIRFGLKINDDIRELSGSVALLR